MGEIAEMMLDGTMDYETGEWNFDGLDGPGFPMTGRDAARFRRDLRMPRQPRALATPAAPYFKVTKAWRRKIEAFGTLLNHDAYHWQVRKDGKVLADWWPHKRKWRLAGATSTGSEADFVKALAKAIGQ